MLAVLHDPLNTSLLLGDESYTRKHMRANLPAWLHTSHARKPVQAQDRMAIPKATSQSKRFLDVLMVNLTRKEIKSDILLGTCKTVNCSVPHDLDISRAAKHMQTPNRGGRWGAGQLEIRKEELVSMRLSPCRHRPDHDTNLYYGSHMASQTWHWNSNREDLEMPNHAIQKKYVSGDLGSQIGSNAKRTSRGPRTKALDWPLQTCLLRRDSMSSR